MTQAREIVEDAYRKIGVVASDEAMQPDQAAAGLREINRLLASWANPPYSLWRKTAINVTLTTAASYYLGERPMRILSARLVQDGIETTMQEMTRGEYDSLPDKASTGLPTTYHYDRQRTAGTLYIWPVLVAAGPTLALTVERPLALCADLNDAVDVPVEWESALVYTLADRLADNHEKDLPKITARAADELRLAMASDIEGSVFFTEFC